MVSLTKGKHNLALGGEFALDKTMFLANLNNYGEITFSTSAPTSTGVALADFMTGQFSGFEQDAPYTTHLSTWHAAAFAQDNYRVTPRFTANLGLRWDIDTPPVDAHNRLASFVPGQQSTVVTSTTSVAPHGQAVPWGQRHRSRPHQHDVQPHFASYRFCMGSVRGWQDLDSRRSGHLLRQSQRQ